MFSPAIIAEFFASNCDLQPIQHTILQAAETIVECYRQGGKLLTCGNGGSCSDADHITGELMKGFLKKRPLDATLQQEIYAAAPDLREQQVADRLQMGLPAISLCTHSALMTAVANDLGPDLMFAQQVMALGCSGDLLIGISTSGNADNVYKAMAVAKAKGLRTLALTGGSGGKLAGLADTAIIVPSDKTPRVQEYHLAIYHFLCALAEQYFFAE